MNRAFRWSVSIFALAILGAGLLFFWQMNAQIAALGGGTVQTLRGVSQAVTVTATPVSAVGTIELVSKRQVVLKSNGIIAEVAVEVGDSVQRGDTLIKLDTQQLEWAVDQANINLENARITLAKATEAVDESDIDLAEANLLSAEENLTEVQAGPTEEEMEAAQASAAAAWAAYNELREGPSPEELTQAQASLKQAEIEVQQAQRAYDKIAWQPDAGMSSEGAALQRASISYESAKAAYDELVKPATTSQLQSAIASAQSAQNALNELEKKPTPAELAAARANVASAEATLADLQKGRNANDVRAAELGVRSAQIALEQAKLDLANAVVFAPIDGTILERNVELGQQGSAGSVIASIADVTQLRLIVNVEQNDIVFVKVGQKAEISVYGLEDKVFHGVVDKIAPQGQLSVDSIVFPVTILFTDESLAELKPGMNATADFVAGE
jgi:multidrug resistance efflux pump